MMDYSFSKKLKLRHEEALTKVTDALKKEGFGILTTIHVNETLKHKLGVDFKPYTILGACNPALAHRALMAEPGLGLFLPCNVVVYPSEDNHTIVSFFNPEIMSAIIDNSDLKTVAEEVKRKLMAVAESL